MVVFIDEPQGFSQEILLFLYLFLFFLDRDLCAQYLRRQFLYFQFNSRDLSLGLSDLQVVEGDLILQCRRLLLGAVDLPLQFLYLRGYLIEFLLFFIDVALEFVYRLLGGG